MAYRVWLTSGAACDLEDIADHLARSDGPGRAQRILTRITQAFEALAEFPQRGRYPTELLEFGNRRYREIFFKPYRIVYSVDKGLVHVRLIADGRRNMRALLLRRLLHAEVPPSGEH